MKRSYASGSQKRKERRDKQKRVDETVSKSGKISDFISRKVTSGTPEGHDGGSTSSQGTQEESPFVGTAENEMKTSPNEECRQIDIHYDSPSSSGLPDHVEMAPPETPAPEQKKKVSVFDPTREFPTDRGLYGQSITDTNLINMIMNHGPCQPKIKFPKSDDGFFVFSEKYYEFVSKTGMRAPRTWLCYSPTLNKPYCQACWLFADRSNSFLKWEWIDGVSGSCKRLSQKIRDHEHSDVHISAMAVAERLRSGNRIDDIQMREIAKQKSFWRQVLMRIINIIITLARLCLPFRGHRELTSQNHCEGGNFLDIVSMQSQFDPVLQKLISAPDRTTKYLSKTIQNEIILLVSSETRKYIVQKINDAPFFSLILDTTSDISRDDHISLVIRWVNITEGDASLNESFLGFIKCTDSTAKGLTDTVSESLESCNIPLSKIRGQGYDGASVMSGVRGGVQTLIRERVDNSTPVPYVHCAAHNLNLVVNDAVSHNVESVSFFGTISEIFKYFGGSLNRWAELAFSSGRTDGLKLKKLCPTRWSSRIDAIRALKNRYVDIMKVLARICIESKKGKERSDAEALKSQMEKFEFIVFIVMWERLLTAINKASTELQSNNMDLGRAIRLLSMARGELVYLRNSWESVILTSTALADQWKIPADFHAGRVRRTKRLFDELCADERPSNPEALFRIRCFNAVIDMAVSQIDERFKDQLLVKELFSFIQPDNLSKISDIDLEGATLKLIASYPKDLDHELLNQIRAFRREFDSEIKNSSTVRDLLNILLSAKLVSSMPELVATFVLFLTLPVTVATAERSFSKLKLIKTYLRSTMSQERLDGLAMISIESDIVKRLDMEDIVDRFAEQKTRMVPFS